MELPIKKILQKYSINAPEVVVCKKVAEIISDELSIKLNSEAVSYQKGKLFISASPLIRSQIQIKKDCIIKRLTKEISSRNIKDIN
jgi:hypothetical protein